MADKKPQKTELLSDAPPEVQAAIDRGRSSQPAAPPSGQATMMLDSPNVAPAAPAAPAQQPQRQVVVPTMMRERPAGSLPPVGKRKSGVGRWIAGPLIAVGVAAGTAALAGVVMPAKPKEMPPPPKVMGKLRVVTDPPGASVTIDGKPFPHFTPTEVEGEAGATLKIGFKLDGYQAKEEEVVIASGERPPFNVRLEKVEAPAAPPPAAPPPAAHHDHHASAPKPVVPKEPVGKSTISVFVRPWAIVYVDGSRLRQTPVSKFEIPSGKHTLELVNEGKGKREKVPLTLKPGEDQEIRRDWDK